MKIGISKNHRKDISKYFILFSAALVLLSGCGLLGVTHREEAKEESKIFGPTEGYNAKIKEAQNYLGKAGFDPGPIDGNMGRQTRKAIGDFQKTNDLKITGFIDSKTWEKLIGYQKINEAAILTAYPDKKFEKGTPKKTDLSLKQKEEVQDEVIGLRLKSSAWVKKIQYSLKNTGFDPGPIDGKMGPKTKKAIGDFQRSRGLVSHGVIDPQTWEELNKYFPKD